MKIGVSSQNFHTITGHAGKARRFFVFEQQADKSIKELERIDLPKEMSLHEFKGDNHPLFNLDIIVTGGCGDGFINRMASHDVQVITTSETNPLEVVKKLLAGKTILPPVPHEH